VLLFLFFFCFVDVIILIPLGVWSIFCFLRRSLACRKIFVSVASCSCSCFVFPLPSPPPQPNLFPPSFSPSVLSPCLFGSGLRVIPSLNSHLLEVEEVLLCV
jgi:hypothetical protein